MRSQLSYQSSRRKTKQSPPPNHLLSAEAGKRKLACFHNAQGIKTLGRKVWSSCLKHVVDISGACAPQSSFCGLTELLLRSLEKPSCGRRPLSLMARGKETSFSQVLSFWCPTQRQVRVKEQLPLVSPCLTQRSSAGKRLFLSKEMEAWKSPYTITSQAGFFSELSLF